MKTTKGKKDHTIELEIPAANEHLAIVRLCVASISAQMEFTVEEIEDIKMAVGEACVNAIHHGYGQEDELKNRVSFQFTIFPDKLAITVEDAGKGFDTKQLEKYTQPNKKKSLKRHGLGLFIMRSLMDKVEFKSSLHGTQVKMVKNKKDEGHDTLFSNVSCYQPR